MTRSTGHAAAAICENSGHIVIVGDPH
jgi:hypothetical protein